MNTERSFNTVQRIHLHDGYQSKSIWKQEKNHSTYYSPTLDRQCRVPIRDINELKRELGML